MKKILSVLAVSFLLSGCATPLNSIQKSELREWKADGLEVQEKDPTAAAFLGLLPGGGSFYTRQYGYGVANLLLWPLSILWDPINGARGAETLNYDTTYFAIRRRNK
ncbi:MAG: hypothetical protein OIF36_02185 [Alphaproteobacteria bacterium]|nr:hypothetical protein [Alphaproteobacteria bacterium]MCV6599276.1 hypothetical protein [Alphaproteobacteria bacterium]